MKSFSGSETCWLHLLRISALMLPKPSALEARHASYRNFLFSLVCLCKITFCSRSLWSGKRGTVTEWRKGEDCLHVNQFFSQDSCGNRNNCLVLWNPGNPPSNSLSLASQQYLRSIGGGWANSLVSSSPDATAPNLVHDFKWVSLQSNTKLTHAYTVKSHETFRSGWQVCKTYSDTLFYVSCFRRPSDIQSHNWKLFYGEWSSSKNMQIVHFYLKWPLPFGFRWDARSSYRFLLIKFVNKLSVCVVQSDYDLLPLGS